MKKIEIEDLGLYMDFHILLKKKIDTIYFKSKKKRHMNNIKTFFIPVFSRECSDM